MGADGQAGTDSSSFAKRSFLRSSIVWKLTLFVGVLVALNGAVLIGVAYVTTSAILQDQIHGRLLTVAAARQEMLANALRQQVERATQFAGRTRIHQLLADRAGGTMTPERFRAETDPILSTVRDQYDRASGSLDRGRVWSRACLERTGQSGGRVFRAETPWRDTRWRPGRSAAVGSAEPLVCCPRQWSAAATATLWAPSCCSQTSGRSRRH